MTSVRRTRAEIEAITSWMLDRARTLDGVCGADVIYAYGESHDLSLRDGEPEENSFGVSLGVGIRILHEDGRQGVASAGSLERDVIESLIDWSYENSRKAEPEEGISLYEGSLANDDTSLALYDERIANDITHEMRMSCCREMTGFAKSRSDKIESVRSASWGDGVYESHYASTAGLCGWKLSTLASCGVSVVMRDGVSFEMGGYGKAERHLEDLDWQAYAQNAVDRTARILGGKPLPTGKYSLILPPDTAAPLVEEIGSLFCSSEVHRGRSMMEGKLGEAIAGSCLTLVDDACIPRGAASSLFDGEGHPTGKTLLIERGVAKNYLYNMQYAAKDGTVSTGNASRGFSSLPDVGASNLVVVPGSQTREALTKSVSDGILIIELMGLHTMDPVSGDFSLGAKGLRVEGGIPGAPVAGVTIAGNLLDFLRRIVAVGSDQESFGDVRTPTLLVEDVVVAGC